MKNFELSYLLEPPHPFPYQGSKRGLAKYILPYFPTDVDCLIEPFCGAGAVSISAVANGLVDKVVLNDLNKPLMDLWNEIIKHPNILCDEYEKLWVKQQNEDKKEFFYKIRSEFNQTSNPHQLLFLLARIVKGAVRYSSKGQFNQSADNRRLGMKPITMRKNIFGVSNLLKHKAILVSADFREVVKTANSHDLIYMDPPYQGTSFTRDHRYLNGLSYDEFVDTLLYMNDANLSYIISYDGITGDKTYGKQLPSTLSLKHIYINAGRSSQATLLGKNQETIESLYLSPTLVTRLSSKSMFDKASCVLKQREFAFS